MARPPDKKKSLLHEPTWQERLRDEVTLAWRSMTRERLINFLKSMIWVAPLTILIWVYAEQQQQQSVTGVTVHIAVKDADPTHVLELEVPREALVTVDIHGAQSAVDRVQEELGKTMQTPLELTIQSHPPSTVAYQIDTQPLLEKNAAFAGVSVSNCNPPQLWVRVDRVDSVSVPVLIPSDLPGLNRAVPHPATVTLSGPSQLLESLHNTLPTAQWGARMALAGDPVLMQQGEHDNYTVRLLPPIDDARLSVVPDTIKADLSIGEADVEKTWDAVPIYVQMDQGLANGTAKVDYPPLLSTATFRGPKAVLDAMDKPIARVVISHLDWKGPRPISFPDLPPGVKYVPPDGQIPTVTVNVTFNGG